MSRPLLLAGSIGPERRATRLDPDDPKWFEPLHIRDQGAARERTASQVAAGADVVVAPTWQTHRRALLRVGETRRARAWTAAAVETTRQGVEQGLERRAIAAQERMEAAAEDETSVAEIDRPAPLVAGLLPRLDAETGDETGRIDPEDVARERDYRDQAGLLSDAGVDLVLVEGLRTVSSTRSALGAIGTTGLPAWAAAIPGLAPTTDDASRLARWADTCIEAGAARLLAPPVAEPLHASSIDLMAASLGGTAERWGAQTVEGPEGAEDVVPAWLDAGAGVIARLDGAHAERLEVLRDGIDAFDVRTAAAIESERRRWRGFVADAAAMAPGGPALWIGPAGPGEPADPSPDAWPPGFAWQHADPGELASLPVDHFRLIITVSEEFDGARSGPLLERGGIVAITSVSGTLRTGGLQVLRVDDDRLPALALLRREA